MVTKKVKEEIGVSCINETIIIGEVIYLLKICKLQRMYDFCRGGLLFFKKIFIMTNCGNKNKYDSEQVKQV